MDKIKHAIIGCGRVAVNHVDAFQKIPDAELIYACDTSPEASDNFVKNFGIPKQTKNFQDVLKDPEITSISLTVPHDLHASMMLEAINNKKHVLVEKPFTIKPDDAKKIIKAMQKENVIVMPVAQHRFDPLIKDIAEMVHQGNLGELVLTRAHLECVRPQEYYKDSDWRGSWEREGGSVLMNQSYHILDLLYWLAGPIHKVSAQMDNKANKDIMETEDTFSANFTYENSAQGSLTVSGAYGAQWYSYIELIGTDGFVAFDIGYPNQLHRFQLKSRRNMKMWRDRFKQSTENAPTLLAGIGYYGVTHRDQARAFVDSILGKSTAEGADVNSAMDVVNTIDKFYESARTGQTINII